MEQRLRQLAARLSGAPPDTVRIAQRAPLTFQSNRLYDIHIGDRHWIAKEFLKPDEFDEAPRREYDALRLVASVDIAPQAVHIEPYTGDALPLVLYEFMPGAMWDRYTPTPAELAQLADLWLTKHSVTRPDLWPARGFEQGFEAMPARLEADISRYSDWAHVNYPPGADAVRLLHAALDRSAQVLERLGVLPPQLCFCRSDARFANVIRRPDGRLGLVDWEDSGLRDPASDVAELMSHPNQEDLLGPEDWQSFLTPYLTAMTPDDTRIAERLHLYQMLFPLFWLAVLVAYGVRRAKADQLAGWHINSLPPNVRLRRYLARTNAWPAASFEDEVAALADVTFFPT
jgi:aminoglycoside phosphotransferase (APT) family kinase protein